MDPRTGEPDYPVNVISIDISFARWVELHRASGASYPDFWQRGLEWILEPPVATERPR